MPILPLHKRDEMIPIPLPLPQLQLPSRTVPLLRGGRVRRFDVWGVVNQLSAWGGGEGEGAFEKGGEGGGGGDVGAGGAVEEGVEEGY